MSLERLEVVDAVGIDKESGEVILTIADAWDWEDELRHLRALQEKLNTYFGYVESGQIWESYPLARGRTLVIDVIGRFPFPESALKLFQNASEVALELGITVRSRRLPDQVQ